MAESVDPGGTERDWKLYTDTIKTPAKDTETFRKHNLFPS